MIEQLNDLESIFQSIDIKLDETKIKNEDSIERLKCSVAKFQFGSVDEGLNQQRDILIKHLKKIHDVSINSLNGLLIPFKQLNHVVGKQIVKSTLQNIENMIGNQVKLSKNRYSPKLIHFIKLKYTNEFGNAQMIKYIHLMPHLLQKLIKDSKRFVPFKDNTYLAFSSKEVKSNPLANCLTTSLELYDKFTGLAIKSNKFTNDYTENINPHFSFVDKINNHHVKIDGFFYDLDISK